MLSQKRLQTRGSEMVFSTFSMRYFSKKNLTNVLHKNIFPLKKSWVVLPATLQPNRATFALTVHFPNLKTTEH